jgi:ATP-dependent Clp protease ATP-binding subunit ClpC
VFDLLTNNAKVSMRRAREAAEKSGQPFLSPEHMLQGVLAVDECGATRILVACGLAPAQLQQALSRRMSAAAEPLAPANFPFTPKAKLVLEAALKESRTAGHARIGTEHLLVAISDSASAIVAEVLGQHRLTVDRLRHALRAQSSKS